jgi:sugar phosphate permease
VPPHEAGLASGLINTSQQIGGALGLAILVAFANSRRDDLLATGSTDPAHQAIAATEGFQTAFMAGAGLAILGTLLALFLIRSSDSRALRDAARAEPVPVAA